jgi:putative membrane protein
LPSGAWPGYGAPVVIAPVLSALHVLALGVGLGSVFMRGRFLRELRAGPDARALDRLFAADTLWGVAAALWLLTGLARAFGHVEKAPDFFLRNSFFWVKMTLFLVVVALEIWPMLTFIRWRIARRAGQPLPQLDRLPRLVLVDDLQTALVVVIPFVAAAMARGLWLY